MRERTVSFIDVSAQHGAETCSLYTGVGSGVKPKKDSPETHFLHLEVPFRKRGEGFPGHRVLQVWLEKVL